MNIRGGIIGTAVAAALMLAWGLYCNPDPIIGSIVGGLCGIIFTYIGLHW